MPIHDQYTREVFNQLKYNATWLPTVRLAPGDVCSMSGHELRVVSHLREFEIDYEVEERRVQSDFEYSSEGAVSMHVKAIGEAPAAGSLLKVEDAGISLSFARSKAVILRLGQCSGRHLKSLHKVGQQILRLHGSGDWPEGYVVVDEIVIAGAATIIISSGDKAGIDLIAKGAVGKGALTLASLDASFQVARESNIGAKFIAEPGLTPLVRVSGIRKPFFGDDTFRGGSSQSSALKLEDVDYVDY